jgi:hypothetical protein
MMAPSVLTCNSRVWILHWTWMSERLNDSRVITSRGGVFLQADAVDRGTPSRKAMLISPVSCTSFRSLWSYFFLDCDEVVMPP